jgi:hypothetical protein
VNQIKFSNYYEKFPKGLNFGDGVQLLHVFVEDSSNLKHDFLDYDTIFINEDGSSGRYSLPNGKLLVLLLRNKKNVFTTIRRWTPKKESYYRGIVGSTLEVTKIEGD